MSIISAGTSNTTSLVYTGDTTGAMVFQTNGTTEAMRITSGQNIGIGTNAPTVKLDIAGSLKVTNSSGSSIVANRTSNPGSIELQHSGTQTAQFSATSGGGFEIYTGSTPVERMRIDSAGNFLIARTSPSWANTRFSLDQTTNPAALLSWYNGYPEVYATGNSPSTKFPYSPSGTQEVKNATSSASTVAGYLMDFIAYNGSTATTAYMGVSAGTTYAANMVFGQRTGVQSWQETMRIDTAGRVTMPFQPGFLVRGYQPSSGSSGGQTFMIITGETVDWEVGGGYSKTGGPAGSVRYTAPIAGYYLITWSLMGDPSAGSRLIAFVNKNGSAITENNSFSSQYNNANTIIVVKLNANDYLDFRFSGPYYTLSNSGHFLGVRLIG